MVQPRKLKFRLNIKINESIMCANFEDQRSRDRELRHKKNIKKRRFLDWKVINWLIIPKPLDVQSWNSGTMRLLTNASCKPSLATPGYVTKILQAENGKNSRQFWTDISRKKPILMKNGLWFFSALSTTFLLVMIVYPNSKLFFLFWIFFLTFFFFFFWAICFWLRQKKWR